MSDHEEENPERKETEDELDDRIRTNLREILQDMDVHVNTPSEVMRKLAEVMSRDDIEERARKILFNEIQQTPEYKAAIEERDKQATSRDVRCV